MKYSNEELGEGAHITMQQDTWEYIITKIRGNLCDFIPIRCPTGNELSPSLNYSITLIKDQLKSGHWILKSNNNMYEIF